MPVCPFFKVYTSMGGITHGRKALSHWEGAGSGLSQPRWKRTFHTCPQPAGRDLEIDPAKEPAPISNDWPIRLCGICLVRSGAGMATWIMEICGKEERCDLMVTGSRYQSDRGVLAINRK